MYSIPARVYVSFTNENGHLKLDSAIDLMQDCSQMWFESEPTLERYFALHDITQMIAFRQVDVLRAPSYGERLSVETRIFDCRSYYGYRNTLIYDEGGGICLQSWSIGAFVSLDTGKLVRMPNEVAAGIGMDEKADMPYTDKRVALPEGGWQALPPFPVRLGDIDMNRHMNNARYAQAAMELLPPGFEAKRLRVEYKLPAKLGEVFHPRMAQAEGRVFIAFEDGDGRAYAHLEFVDTLQ